MERSVDYDEFMAQKRRQARSLAATLGRRRAARNRPRNEAERRSLMELDRLRLERLYATGERRWVGPRAIAVRL